MNRVRRRLYRSLFGTVKRVPKQQLTKNQRKSRVVCVECKLGEIGAAHIGLDNNPAEDFRREGFLVCETIVDSGARPLRFPVLKLNAKARPERNYLRSQKSRAD